MRTEKTIKEYGEQNSYPTRVSVSVVIPFYRNFEELKRALYSVLSQTAWPIEVLVIDDGSGGNSISYMDGIAEQFHQLNIRVFHFHNNEGASSARNFGWNHAEAKYIAFLDADDAWETRKLQIQYEFMVNNPDIDLTGHRHKIIINSDDFSNTSIQFPIKATQISLTRLLLVNQFVTPSIMMKSNYPARFKVKQRYMEDYDLWLTMALQGAKMVRLEIELTALFKEPFGESGLSSHLIQMEKGELLTYWSLCKKKPALILILPLLLAYSLIKFVRRLFVTYFQNSSFIKVK